MNLQLDGVNRVERGADFPTPTAGPSSGNPVHSYFKREVGPLARAQLHFGSYSQLPRPTSQAALRGVRFEKKVLLLLSKRFGNRLLCGPLFSFQDAMKSRNQSAYPDALLFDEKWKSLSIVEVKYRHTGDAWFQLDFYRKIVQKALPMFRVCTLEICASYDPSQRLPKEVAFLDNPEGVFETREVFHPLHVLTERELKNDRGLA